MERVAALTGATGFIGRELMYVLRAQGWHVRALTRKPPLPDTRTSGIDWIEGDLDNSKSLATLTEGVDAVFHLAGAIKAPNRQHFDHVNRQGVANIAAATHMQAPNARFIMVSSLAARAPHISDYAASKAAGEAVLEGFPDMDWTIIRPPAVYGPGDMEILKIFKPLKYGIAVLPGGTANRVSLIHARDLCTGLIALVDTSTAKNRILTIADGKENGYSPGDIIAMGAEILKKSPRLIAAPKIMLSAAALLNQGFSALIGATPILTVGKVRELYHEDWVCNAPGVVDVCSWRPEISAQKGLEETLLWYQKRKFL